MAAMYYDTQVDLQASLDLGDKYGETDETPTLVVIAVNRINTD